MTAHEGETRYPFFGVPPAKAPRPAANEPALWGKRVILSTPEGFVYDMRAVSDLRTDGEGGAIVDIASEEHYSRWMFTKQSPAQQLYPVHLVWVEG
ncbi:MAG: hypothetical protein ACTHOK_02265 [Nocardioidaceae bacterium]